MLATTRLPSPYPQKAPGSPPRVLLRSVHLKHRLTSDWSGDPSVTAGTLTSRRGGIGVASDSTKRFDAVACQNASFRGGPAHGGR